MGDLHGGAGTSDSVAELRRGEKWKTPQSASRFSIAWLSEKDACELHEHICDTRCSNRAVDSNSESDAPRPTRKPAARPSLGSRIRRRIEASGSSPSMWTRGCKGASVCGTWEMTVAARRRGFRAFANLQSRDSAGDTSPLTCSRATSPIVLRAASTPRHCDARFGPGSRTSSGTC